MQAVCIGLITLDGTVPADLSFVGYLGIPLAMVAGGIGAAITTLSTPLVYSSAELTNSVQSQLDDIFPQLLPPLLRCGCGTVCAAVAGRSTVSC